MVTQVLNRGSTKETSTQMDKEIKLFLSILNNVTKFLKTKNITWIESNNYQSLLNLPYAVFIFGSLVKFWEGGNCGKDHLRHIKLRIRGVHAKIRI